MRVIVARCSAPRQPGSLPTRSTVTTVPVPLLLPLQDFLFEEASLLRSRELELKARLSGAPELAPVLPVVEVRGCGAALWCSAVVHFIVLRCKSKVLTSLPLHLPTRPPASCHPPRASPFCLCPCRSATSSRW